MIFLCKRLNIKQPPILKKFGIMNIIRSNLVSHKIIAFASLQKIFTHSTFNVNQSASSHFFILSFSRTCTSINTKPSLLFFIFPSFQGVCLSMFIYTLLIHTALLFMIIIYKLYRSISKFHDSKLGMIKCTHILQVIIRIFTNK